MQNKIKDVINEVKQNKADSEKQLEEAMSSVKNLKNDIQEIKDDAYKNADVIFNKIKNDAEKQAKNIVENSSKIISAEEKQIITDLVKEISKLSIEKSKENLINSLNNNIELHEKYISESIDNLDRLTL